mgnify:CR=1 FL=1
MVIRAVGVIRERSWSFASVVISRAFPGHARSCVAIRIISRMREHSCLRMVFLDFHCYLAAGIKRKVLRHRFDAAQRWELVFFNSKTLCSLLLVGTDGYHACIAMQCHPKGCAAPGEVRCQCNTRESPSKLKRASPQAKINVTSKSPVGDISVVTLIRTDTTLDHSQKAEKV